MHKYTPEQRAFIEKNCVSHSYAELRDLVNSKFDLQLTLGQINGYLGNHKLKTGRTGRFEKGHIPANRGQKGIHLSPATEFKKGQRPSDWRPVGSEGLREDGYVWVKIAEPNKWRQKHVVVWEAAHEPRPKDHVVIFGDGNRLNFDLENLILISRGELAVLNHKSLIGKSAELTRIGILAANITMKYYDRIRNSKKKMKNENQ